MKKIFLLLIYLSPMLLQAQISANTAGAVNTINLDISSLTRQFKEITGSIRSIGETIKSIRADLQAQQTALATVKKKRDKAKADLDKAEADGASSARIAELRSELAKWEQEIEKINKQIEKLAKLIDQQTDEINKLEEALDKLEQKIVETANKERAEGKGNQKTDSIIKAEKISFYVKTIKLLQADPSIRAGLTAAELKTLTDFENKYKSDNAFRTGVDKEKQAASLVKAADNSKESSEAARDRKKAQMDSMKKFLDILASMNPQI